MKKEFDYENLPVVDIVNDIIVDAIKNNAEANLSELAKITGKSPSTVKRTIAKLTQDGLVERIGSKRDGSWRLTK